MCCGLKRRLISGYFSVTSLWPEGFSVSLNAHNIVYTHPGNKGTDKATVIGCSLATAPTLQQSPKNETVTI